VKTSKERVGGVDGTGRAPVGILVDQQPPGFRHNIICRSACS
jgi:hypothetical protein